MLWQTPTLLPVDAMDVLILKCRDPQNFCLYLSKIMTAMTPTPFPFGFLPTIFCINREVRLCELWKQSVTLQQALT